MSVVVFEVYNGVKCQDCFACQLGKLKLQVYESFLAFFNLGRVVS